MLQVRARIWLPRDACGLLMADSQLSPPCRAPGISIGVRVIASFKDKKMIANIVMNLGRYIDLEQ